MIEQNDINRLDERYVKHDVCETKHAELKDKLANNDTQLALIQQQLKSIIWILGIVATTSVASVLTAIFKLILK